MTTHFWYPIVHFNTLGDRDFSSAVSGFCQSLYSDPREKPLEQSTIARERIFPTVLLT